MHDSLRELPFESLCNLKALFGQLGPELDQIQATFRNPQVIYPSIPLQDMLTCSEVLEPLRLGARARLPSAEEAQ